MCARWNFRNSEMQTIELRVCHVETRCKSLSNAVNMRVRNAEAGYGAFCVPRFVA